MHLPLCSSPSSSFPLSLSLQFCTFLRFIVVPLFLGASKSWTPILSNDVFVGAVMSCFAVTNGYLASCEWEEEREREGVGQLR